VQALSIGVDYHTFWTLTPKKLEPFIKAYHKKREFEMECFCEKANFTAWLEGIYFARAIAINFSKDIQYFEKPIDFKSPVHETNKAIQFEAWAAKMNRSLDKR